VVGKKKKKKKGKVRSQPLNFLFIFGEKNGRKKNRKGKKGRRISLVNSAAQTDILGKAGEREKVKKREKKKVGGGWGGR